MNKRYKFLIFDFDGTLAATEPAIQFCMKAAFSEYGLTPPSDDVVRRAIGIPLNDMVARVGGLGKADADAVTDIYRRFYKKEGMEMTRLFPNALETVRELKKRGYILLVVSNKNHEVANISVEKTGLMPFFSMVQGEKDGLCKPSSRVFTEIVAPFFNALPDECLMIGDAIQDTTFALNCGMDCAFASYGFGIEKDCINKNVKFILNDISVLTDILD